MKFKLSKSGIEKCSKFAADSVFTSIDCYLKRNQDNFDKIKIDIKNGKVGELITFSYIKKMYNDVTYPDFKIYAAKDKTWDSDLTVPSIGKHIAVKTYSTHSEFPESWIFQNSDKGIFSSIESEDKKHYVSFVTLNYLKKEGEIKAIVTVDWLKKNSMFKETRKKSLRGNKLAVYFDDLKKHTNIWQF